jgi:hypothetical protein
VQFVCRHCDSFRIEATGRASIRAAEHGFQTQGHVGEVIPGAIVISMRKEFESLGQRTG